MDKIITCDNCEKAIDKEAGYVIYIKKIMGIEVTINVCLSCLQELIDILEND